MGYPADSEDRVHYDPEDHFLADDWTVELLNDAEINLNGVVKINGEAPTSLPSSEASDAETIAGVSSTKTITPRRVTVIAEKYDVRRSSVVMGAGNDNTIQMQAAADLVKAIPLGGALWIPQGVCEFSELTLGSKVSLCGAGNRSSWLTQHANAAVGQHLIQADVDAIQIEISDLAINGNRSNQTNVVDAIHLTNDTGAPGTNARHIINNVHIENVKGVGLYLGAFMRACQIDKVSVYFADLYGIQLESFADSQIGQVEVGQSGGHGFYIHGANTVQFGQLRSWFSGRLTTGTSGYGVYIHDGSNLQFTAILAQENSGNGITVFGQSAVLEGLIIKQALCDGDNSVASTFAGMSLNNVARAQIGLSVRKHTGAVGTPSNAISLAGGTTGCIIDLSYANLSSFPIVGADVGKNEFRLGRLPVVTTYAASVTPQPYTNSLVTVTLTGPITINAPNMNPLIAGTELTVQLIQDGVGGRVTTWNAVFKTVGADVTTAGLRNIRKFICDGTNWIQTSLSAGV